MGELWGIGVIAAGMAAIFAIGWFVSRQGAKMAARARRETSERMEALFKATFPELQPHFHPARVNEYVRARRARVPSGGASKWRKPAGFPAAEVAEMVLEGMKDHVRLLDAAGALVAEFAYEEHPEGGVIRLGKGKFTVNVKGPEPRVRYWHPQREFKWTPTSWKIQSGVSDSALESSRGDSTSDSGSWSSTSTTATAAAATAGIVAAGGSFDGGGASNSWDDSGGGSSSSEGGSGFSNVESGSSSTASSTTY